MLVSTLILPLLSLVVCLSAASLRVPAVSPAELGRALTPRQVSIGTPSPLPSQCTSTCSPITNEVNLGCPVEACCTTTFETQYYNCLECIGLAVDAGNYSRVQNSLNLLWTTCVDVGFVLPRLELPGQSNSSNATSTASALSPTGTTVTGTAVRTWHIVEVEALIGAAVLLGLAGLW